MKLYEVMTPDVRGLDLDESIRSAAVIMAEMRVGAVPIFRDGLPVGIVTDRDLVVRAIAGCMVCDSTPVREVMSCEPLILWEELAVEDALDQMARRQVRRVLVANDQDEIVGIVSLGDIATTCANRKACGETIKKVSEPCEPLRA